MIPLSDRFSSPGPVDNAKRNLFGSSTTTSQGASNSSGSANTNNVTLSPARIYLRTVPGKVVLQQSSKSSGMYRWFEFPSLFDRFQELDKKLAKLAQVFFKLLSL